MDLSLSDAEQLNNNLELLNSELYSLIDSPDAEPHVQHAANYNESEEDLLQEISRKFDAFSLDESGAPVFEFHDLTCYDYLYKRRSHYVKPQRGCRSGLKKSKWSGATNSCFVSRQKQQQLQRENMWNQKTCNNGKSLEKQLEETVQIIGSCLQRNAVQRLLELFRSVHEDITTDLPSNQLNTLPSDYFFEIPVKGSMPKGVNMRHHVQVLCTKVDRFLVRQRRTLETNRFFDYVKYNECGEKIQTALQSLQGLREFTVAELRVRAMDFTNNLARQNAERLEALLSELLEHIKNAHLYVYVFNWEMDLEHRYSLAMTQRHEATKSHALELIEAAKLKEAQASEFSFEEQLIADRYQLGNIVSCAKEHEDFLTALLQSPETYFSPEIIALCEPPKNGMLASAARPICANDGAANMEHLAFGADIINMAPSSPPRFHHRNHVPRRNRS